jgi:collagen type VI alpha
MVGRILVLALLGFAVVQGQGVTTCTDTMEADINFVVDASSSVGTANWELVKQFMNNIVEKFVIGDDQVRVAVVTYATRVSYALRLEDSNTKAGIQGEISNLKYLKGTTFTDMALDKTREAVFTQLNLRAGVPRLAIVITDGASRYPQATLDSAANLRDHGIKLIAVGIKDADQDELLGIAGEESNVFSVDDFDKLDSIVDSISSQACVTVIPPEPPCTPKAEIVFIVDGSSSIGNWNWKKIKNFMAAIVDSFDVSDDAVRVGVVLFSHKVSEQFGLDKYSDKETIKTKIQKLPYIRGLTFTDIGIKKARESTLADDKVRAGAAKFGIVISDGKSRYPDSTLDEANKAREQGIVLAGVGINDYDRDELIDIVGGDESMVFETDHFNDLAVLMEPLIQATCDATTE